MYVCESKEKENTRLLLLTHPHLFRCRLLSLRKKNSMRTRTRIECVIRCLEVDFVLSTRLMVMRKKPLTGIRFITECLKFGIVVTHWDYYSCHPYMFFVFPFAAEKKERVWKIEMDDTRATRWHWSKDGKGFSSTFGGEQYLFFPFERKFTPLEANWMSNDTDVKIHPYDSSTVLVSKKTAQKTIAPMKVSLLKIDTTTMHFRDLWSQVPVVLENNGPVCWSPSGTHIVALQPRDDHYQLLNTPIRTISAATGVVSHATIQEELDYYLRFIRNPPLQLCMDKNYIIDHQGLFSKSGLDKNVTRSYDIQRQSCRLHKTGMLRADTSSSPGKVIFALFANAYTNTKLHEFVVHLPKKEQGGKVKDFHWYIHYQPSIHLKITINMQDRTSYRVKIF